MDGLAVSVLKVRLSAGSTAITRVVGIFAAKMKVDVNSIKLQTSSRDLYRCLYVRRNEVTGREERRGHAYSNAAL